MGERMKINKIGRIEDSINEWLTRREVWSRSIAGHG